MVATKITIVPFFREIISDIGVIKWTVENCDDGVDFVNVQFSKDGGDNYTTLASVGCGTTSHNWDTTLANAPNGTNYIVRVFLDSDINVNGVSKIFEVFNGSHVKIGTGSVGSKFIRTDYPVEEGLIAGYTKQTLPPNLEEE